MQEFKREFIQFAIARNVLRFGEFKLKSGRISPYFFNSGLFNDAESLCKLGEFYAAAIEETSIQYDMLFGPAYKGIPLASAMAIALYKEHNKSVPYCFNRKEVKDHGEGGLTLGAEPQGKVIIVDDVISAGTSIKLSIDIISGSGANVVAAIVALDRQERGQGKLSAIQEIEQNFDIDVINIITLNDIMDYLETDKTMNKHKESINLYRSQYGINK